MEFVDVFIPSEYDSTQIPITNRLLSLPHGLAVSGELHSIGDYLKGCIGSEGYLVYWYKPEDEALIMVTKPSENACTDVIEEKLFSWNIHTGKTIATYAFNSKAPVLVEGYSSVNLDYPYLQDLSCIYPRYIMSIPLMTTKRVFGVFEFYRDKINFNSSDVRKCQFILKQCAEALIQNENAIYYDAKNMTHKELQQYIQFATQVPNEDLSYEFVHKVVDLVRENTLATSASILLEKNNVLVEIADAGEGYSVPNADRALAPICRTLIVEEFIVRILGKKLRGMIRACNKADRQIFTPFDQQLLRPMAKMCMAWAVIEYTNSKIRKQKIMMDTLLVLMQHQIKDCYQLHMFIPSKTATFDDLLDTWLYTPCNTYTEREAVGDLMWIFKECKATFPVEEDNLREFISFITMCLKRTNIGVRSVLYAVHSLFMMVKTCRDFAGESTYEAGSMMLATLASQIDVSLKICHSSVLHTKFNNSPHEVLRLRIVKDFALEANLFSQITEDEVQIIFKSLTNYMMQIHMDDFKRKASRFSQFLRIDDVDLEKFVARQEIPLNPVHIPGLACIVGHYRTPESSRDSKFSFSKFLHERNLSCQQLFTLISSIELL